MSITVNMIIGSDSAGLSLAAIQYDAAGDAIGDPITTGFSEIGTNYDGYTFYRFAGTLDDTARSVRFYDQADTTDFVVFGMDEILARSAAEAVKAKTDGLNFTGTDVKATLDGEEVTPTTASKTGYALSAAGVTAVTAGIWNALTSGITTAGSIGKWLLDYMLLKTVWTDVRGAKLDYLDQAISSIDTGQGTGARTVVITVNDGSDPLENALVRMTSGAESYIGSTDSNGQITFSLDDATWTVVITKPLYTFTSTTLVVDENETQTYSMTAISISAPDAPTLCTVQFRVKLSDVAVSGAVCKAKLQGINQASDGTILSNAESSDTTDSEGVAELQLVRKGSIVKGNGVYKIWVTIAGAPVASVETTIPNQSTILFEDLLKA